MTFLEKVHPVCAMRVDEKRESRVIQAPASRDLPDAAHRCHVRPGPHARSSRSGMPACAGKSKVGVAAKSSEGGGVFCRYPFRPLTRRLLGCQSGSNPVSDLADRDACVPPFPYRAGERDALADEAPGFVRPKREDLPDRSLSGVDPLSGPGGSFIVEHLRRHVSGEHLWRGAGLDERLNW